jgi:hypothetical protein
MWRSCHSLAAAAYLSALLPFSTASFPHSFILSYSNYCSMQYGTPLVSPALLLSFSLRWLSSDMRTPLQPLSAVTRDKLYNTHSPSLLHPTMPTFRHPNMFTTHLQQQLSETSTFSRPTALKRQSYFCCELRRHCTQCPSGLFSLCHSLGVQRLPDSPKKPSISPSLG